ncbi:MAG TPA: DUF4199 domain-containing protein [Lacibacter sp.]|nr:DUF4199 domain-containing protein [Lacibacter sp.]HMO90445.1 DUF4199 domain-containing protein [Lacibacter sp.]HMP87660.1 DUF4199 domain-containing protein [Lacibacter sp.]
MQKFSLEIRWGVVFFATTLCWMLLERVAGLHDQRIELHPVISGLFFIPAVAVYVLALRAKKRQLGGTASYKQLLVSGLIITGVVTLLSPLAQYITSYWITPDYFRNMIDYSVRNGKLTQEEAEATFNFKSYVQQTVVFTPAAGILTTVIAAFFIRSRQR